jgi:multidrug resistance efflux pump
LKVTFREVMRHELWTKKTSQKILAGLAIVACAVLLVVWIWNQIELHWLTSGEREAARAALSQIDSLHDAVPLSAREFQIRSDQSRAKIETARKAARTYRDVTIEMDLEWYLLEAEMEERKFQGHEGPQEFQRVVPELPRLNEVRSELHKALE